MHIVLNVDKLEIHTHLDDVKQDEIIDLLRQIKQQGETMAGEVAKLEQDVADQTTVIQSAITLLQNIKALLDAAGTDPAKLAALSAAIETNSANLAAAVVANTPGSPGQGGGI